MALFLFLTRSSSETVTRHSVNSVIPSVPSPHPLPQPQHRALQALKIEFQRGGAGNPDQVALFVRLRPFPAIDLPHPAAKPVADRGGAEALRRQESHRAGFAGRDRLAREVIERQVAIADAAALIAGGVENGSPPNDAGPGKNFRLGRGGRILRREGNRRAFIRNRAVAPGPTAVQET